MTYRIEIISKCQAPFCFVFVGLILFAAECVLKYIYFLLCIYLFMCVDNWTLEGSLEAFCLIILMIGVTVAAATALLILLLLLLLLLLLE